MFLLDMAASPVILLLVPEVAISVGIIIVTALTVTICLMFKRKK